MPAMTIQTFQVKTDEQGNPKKDNYGNTQMMIKFNESPETVYKAVKDPSTITEGKVMYGTIVEGQFGYKFQADPYNQPGQAPSKPFSAPQQQAIAGIDSSISELKEIRDMLLATYKAVTGEDYVGVQKETTSAQKPVTEPVQTSETPPVEAYTDIDEVDLSNIPFN